MANVIGTPLSASSVDPAGAASAAQAAAIAASDPVGSASAAQTAAIAAAATVTATAISTAPKLPPAQVVGSCGFQDNQQTAFGSSIKRWTLRKRRTTGPQDVTQIQVAYAGWYENDAGAGDANASSSPTLSTSLEIAADTATSAAAVAKSSFFGNETLSTVITPGIPIVLTKPAQFDVPANTDFFVQTEFDWGTAAPTFINGGSIRNGDSGYASDATAASQLNTTGGLTSPSGTGTTYYPLGGDIAIIGRPKKTHVAIALMGDSITQGTGDALPDGNGTLGFQMKATAIGAYPNSTFIPSVNFGKGSAYAYNEETSCLSKRAFLQYFTHATYFRARNDLANGRTAAQTIASLTRNFQAYKRIIGANGKPLYILAILVGPSSTCIFRVAAPGAKWYLAGTGNQTYAGPSINAAGSGYPASSTFTVTGPTTSLATGQSAATFSVTTNASGVPTSVTLLTPGGYLPDSYNYFFNDTIGEYPSAPSGSIATTTTTTGSGLTLNIQLSAWTNGADQIVTSPGWNVGGYRDQVNTWLKTTALTSGLIDDYFDPNPFWEDPNYHGCYITTGVAWETTPEGIHPAGLLHNAAATGSNPNNYLPITGTAATSLQAKFNAFTV